MNKHQLFAALLMGCMNAVAQETENGTFSVSSSSTNQVFRRHDISFALGFGANQADHSRDDLVHKYQKRYNLVHDWLDDEFSWGDSYLTASFEYHYRLNPKWDVGALVAWGASRKDYAALNFYDVINPLSQTTGGESYHGGERCFTLLAAPSVRYTWMGTPHIKLYSRVALGVMRHRLRFYLWEYSITHEQGEQGEQAEQSYYYCLGNVGENKTKWGLGYQLTAIGGSIGSKFLHVYGELGYGCLGVFRIGISYRF